jgi:tetratricopeptide (TPR) repeat protein
VRGVRRLSNSLLQVVVLGALGAGALGCAGEDRVVRVVDGRPVPGVVVPADAYAAYLRGSIADEAGDLDAAIEGYAIAATLGPRDPEPLARLGDARCRRSPHDPSADEAIGRALAIDGAYEPALEARARCAERRGDVRLALESARRAAKADPAAVEPLAMLARLQPADPGAADELRARLIAMTLVAGTDAAAWRALATWARGHGDATLEGRALGSLASLVSSRPSGSAEIDAAIRRLAGEGENAAARALASARVEGSGAGEIDAFVARLAIDDALLSGDVAGARRVATRAHLEPVVVAGRALVLGDDESARAIASTLSAAEPRAIAPRLVLAGAAEALGEGAIAARALEVRGSSGARVPPEVWLAYGRTLARSGSNDAARALLQAIPRDPLVPGDPVATPVAVALAAGGALDPAELDANGAIELAERRAEPATDAAIAAADARHRLLALARRAPHDPKTIELARALGRAHTRDPLVAVAFARLSLAGAIDAPSVGDVLARLDPANPLVAAAALDCALRAGDAHAIPLARARLAAVAHTPAERARIVE